MNNSSELRPDPLDALLGVPVAPDRRELRQSLLAETQRLLRRRVRWQHCGRAAVLAACYGAGIVTVRLVPSSTHVTHVPVAADPRGSESAAVTARGEPEAPLSPEALERLGETAEREHRARYFRLAGARYEQSGDLQSAARCYGHFLNAGTENDLAVSASDDSWLLMALKSDREKEKYHAAAPQ